MNILQRKKAAIKLGLSSINNSDTFIASFPKSGNTWLRFIIANMITDEHITLKNIDQYIPDIYNFKTNINNNPEPRFIKTHHAYYESYPKTIYIHRDYRDVLISFYHFQKSLGKFEGEFKTFIETMNSPFGTWKNHVNSALKQKAKHPDRILILSYESMLLDPKQYIEQIATFCNISPKKSINEIVSNCSFDSLKKIERDYGRTFETPNLIFFRKGESNQWKNEISSAENEYIVNQNRALFEALNYPTV